MAPFMLPGSAVTAVNSKKPKTDMNEHTPLLLEKTRWRQRAEFHRHTSNQLILQLIKAPEELRKTIDNERNLHAELGELCGQMQDSVEKTSTHLTRMEATYKCLLGTLWAMKANN